MKNSIKIGLASLIALVPFATFSVAAQGMDMGSSQYAVEKKLQPFVQDIEQGTITESDLTQEKVQARLQKLLPTYDPAIISSLDLTLLVAASLGKLNAVKTLIRLGAQNSPARSGVTALMLACQNGYPGIVTELLAITKDVNQADGEGNTALHYTVPNPMFTLSNKYLAIYGSQYESMAEDAYEKWVHDQINNAYIPIAQQLLKAGALINKKNNDGTTPLMKACEYEWLPIIKAFIAAKADVNMQDKYGYTPLMLLILHGRLEYTQDKGQAAVLTLLNAGAQVDTEDIDGRTALMHAVSRRIIEVVRILISKKANIHKRDLEGNTPLIMAAWAGDIEALKLLIQLKADVNAQDNYGNTTLMKVLSYSGDDRPQLFEILINAGIDVNKQNVEGNTALIEASGSLPYDSTGLVALLLKAKANPFIKNKRGETALDRAKTILSRIKQYAREQGTTEDSVIETKIVSLLEAAEKGYAIKK